ncbi:sensor histidine kinase [Anaeromyxobacter dehalogenans]|uniref:histidine kinase n=1 Tax=Anaeromyxobacter dehalogenans (strain 2CP-C) TaxID=290397 RepID=Q2IJF3_ANADE|nr:ATP-binding protein [Anaeromyxobacter dehalogenans]ABC81781.1 periplasmic sensor signal transduction histidine kinase [Anaeromyxobacter dehalogenans 2CP-C]
MSASPGTSPGISPAPDPPPPAEPAARTQENGRTAEEDRALERLARAIAPASLGALGLEIPWQQRLSTKLFAMIGAVALATVGLFFLAEIAVQRHLLGQVVQESDLLSQTVRNALHRAMLQDRRGDAYLIMQDVARQAGIERVRMMDANGRVTFSTVPEEVGLMVDRDAEACSGCHAAGQPLRKLELEERSRVFRSGDHRVLGIMTPVYNEASCSTGACHAHPAAKEVLGVIDLDVSLARLDAQTHTFRWRTLAAAALASFLLGLFAWLFTRHHLMRPIAALVQATRRVAREQLELEVPITWSGELGLLAASFNDMTRSLRSARRDLDALMSSLEQQVLERTAALRAAQDQLVRSEKLSSLGKLSASIAHEINNPLAGILTFAKLIVRTLDQGVPDDATRKTLVKHLLLVQRETERCSAIVRNLLDFARERPLTLKDVDLDAVVEEGVQLLSNQINIQNVTLEKRLVPLPPVEGDFGQLRQACVNVIMNACEAMARGGKLTVESALVEGGRWVEVAFTDTGPGIAPAHLSKIFDPFFTTKERGTGLGLSVVYGIVERHHGKIEIHSEVGKGTRVAIRLPPRKAAE